MACGLPWVSTPWGVAAALAPGECGLVVPPALPERLASAITELMSDPQRCSEMGLRGRKRVESDYTLDKYLQQHLKVIRETRKSAGERILYGAKDAG
jgi:glycosyltransferase involved in cell wall biosynthesis